MTVEVKNEYLAHVIFSHSAPMSVLLELEREPAHCEELARRMDKGTGYLRKQLRPLVALGCITSETEKNRIVYSPTSYGEVMAEILRLLSLVHDVNDEMMMKEIYLKISELSSLIYRHVNGELFDRHIVDNLEPTLNFTAKLYILIKTIHPHRAFTSNEVFEECRKVFPGQKISKKHISTCLTRFRNKDDRNYISNLYFRGSGQYLLE